MVEGGRVNVRALLMAFPHKKNLEPIAIPKNFGCQLLSLKKLLIIISFVRPI
jgi:hypothetical protein